jgi:serine/threonine-protein kinase
VPDPDATRSFVPAPTADRPGPSAHPPTATEPLGTGATGASFGLVADVGSRRATATPLPPAPPGYEVLERLGGGGMGEVFLARELASRRPVAMKFLRRPGDAVALDRFVRELQALAELDHPHIVRLFAHDFLCAAPFFTMEHLEGGPLSGRLDDGPLAPAEAVRLVRAVAGAVGAAHARGIVHRDVKPSNILLASDGTPKVADFGLAKLLDDADPLTASGGGLGTPGYMPPEQISKRFGAVGPCSDVYGLGATLYHLLTGRPPFVGDAPQEVVQTVLTDDPPRPRALRPEVPPGLEAVVVKCLEKRPQDRYQSMAEVIAELDRYEAGRRTAAPRMTRWRRARRWAVRHRVRLAVAVLAAAGAAALFTPVPPVRDPEKPDPREVIRQQLRAGKEVVLIGDRGEPLWSAWRVGGSLLGRADPGDGIVFEVLDTGMLELLDDPGIDSYTLRAQIRQTRSSGGADHVGVYFGHADLSATDPPTHAFFAVWFTDRDPLAPPAGPVKDQPANLVHVLRTIDPLGRLTQHPTTFAQCMFTPVALRPGAWRTVEIDVTPGELRARWRDEHKAPKSLRGAPPMVPARKFAELQGKLNDTRPGTAILLPPWSPRLPFGVYARASAVNVRNVTVAPLPVP